VFVKDFKNRKATCPLDNAEDSSGSCLQDVCALWHNAADPAYSCCCLYLIAHDLETLSYHAARDAKKNAHD